jgi:hypothetical protein
LQAGSNTNLRNRISALERDKSELTARLAAQTRAPASAAQQASIAELSKSVNALQQQLLFAQQEVRTQPCC